VAKYGKNTSLVFRCVPSDGLSLPYQLNEYQGAVKAKGLDKLLQQAREENPLVDPVPPRIVSPSKR